MKPLDEMKQSFKKSIDLNENENNNKETKENNTHQFHGINYCKENLQGLRNTNKKFALTSTSSTLEYFSSEYQAFDKKNNKHEKNDDNIYALEPASNIQISHTERKSIESEL